MKKNLKSIIIVLIILLVFFMIGISINKVVRYFGSTDFVILSNYDNSVYDDEIIKFGEENNINVSFVHADDLEAIDLLTIDSSKYDAVWLSNSTWLYMLNGVKTTNSKLIYINPVVFGIKKSKANELGFVNNDNLYNKDIVNAIKDKKFKYVMSSVVKTNTGMVAYLNILNSLAGSPEILTSEILENDTLKKDLIDFFSGVERVSGSDDFLQEMFLRSDDYEGVIATESSLININKKLINQNKEPLYLLYPVDGVALNDSPFAYIENKQEKIEEFNLIQSFLLSSYSQNKLESLGKRTWYGGIKNDADSSSFRKEWGIDTSKYIIGTNYPSKAVMDDAISLYIDELRKPSATVFCLDYSGSMYGEGQRELTNAMNYILDYNEARKDRIQFSNKDKIYVIPFDDIVKSTIMTDNGRETSSMLTRINGLDVGGQTNLYGCAQNAISEIQNLGDNYTKTIILMTDGEANVGSFEELRSTYMSSVARNNEKIPIYSIMFGSARERQLRDIAELTNGKVFDGRENLKEAFKEVRSYN